MNPAAPSPLTSSAIAALDRIVDCYLTSGDFNGYVLTLGADDVPNLSDLERLLDAGLIQVVSERDYPNPHIRPWPSRRDRESQLATLKDIYRGSGSCCLYPTPLAMKSRDLTQYADRPYTAALAAGRGTLELEFFSVAAIEPYRNDPRYHFTHEDFGVTFGIGDNAYLSEHEPESDKIHTVRAGFAYDADALSTDQEIVHRYVCAFLCDLGKLTAIHQQRLWTWRYEGGKAEPHPVWWAMQMGHWPDRIGPFDKIVSEMEALNAVWGIAYGESLFRTTERPREWGWVLRPSTTEWDAFVLLTDKLLSDNLRHEALTAAGAPRRDAHGQNIGSLNRLQAVLTTRTTVTEENARQVLQSLRDVRSQRHRPAHALQESLTDHTIVGRQRDLLFEIGDSLGAIRRFVAKHPKVRRAGWQAPDYLDDRWWVI